MTWVKCFIVMLLVNISMAADSQMESKWHRQIDNRVQIRLIVFLCFVGGFCRSCSSAGLLLIVTFVLKCPWVKFSVCVCGRKISVTEDNKSQFTALKHCITPTTWVHWLFSSSIFPRATSPLPPHYIFHPCCIRLCPCYSTTLICGRGLYCVIASLHILELLFKSKCGQSQRLALFNWLRDRVTDCVCIQAWRMKKKKNQRRSRM